METRPTTLQDPLRALSEIAGAINTLQEPNALLEKVLAIAMETLEAERGFILLTSDDVLHAWAVPALITKLDAVPGRINETWMRINREGTYYGQCSELCGVNHGFMPVAVEAVSKEAFRTWVETARKEFARAHTDVLQVAETGTAAR